MKALVGAFNQEKALVGAFSVIVQPVVEPMEHYTALVVLSSVITCHNLATNFLITVRGQTVVISMQCSNRKYRHQEFWPVYIAWDGPMSYMVINTTLMIIKVSQ